MQAEIIIAIIAASVSAGSAALSVVSGSRTALLQHQLTMQREEHTRRLQLDTVMGRYREPVLRSAVDLQSRLYNIARNRFLKVYFVKSEAERAYAITSTLYVVAEYLGWVEILRREVQYLDLGDLQANRRLAELLERITTWFLTDEVDDAFRLFRGEQRAIGEIMLVARPVNELARYECLGFAAFVLRLDHPEFAKWFARMTDDVERLAKCDDVSERRLRALQHALIDLIDFLDRDRARVPENRREKLS